MKKWLLGGMAVTALASAGFGQETKRPNIIFMFADDISAREIPAYNSTVWSDLTGRNTTDPELRAKTPMLDKMAEQGCLITNAWAATSCSPSRAMVMTGRFASSQKWWENEDYGKINTPRGERLWMLYESSQFSIGQVAKIGGYASVWSGKTQMKCNPAQFQRFGFDEGVLAGGDESNAADFNNSFRSWWQKRDGKRVLINHDNNMPVTKVYPYPQRSTAFKPNLTMLNEKGKVIGIEWWPNTPESKATYGLNTYGPDVELEYNLDFMERKKNNNKPFFVYHATHLGHDAFDWIKPYSGNKWPGTPKIEWDGTKYTRTQPNITGSKGVYNDNATVTKPGIHSHINYIDYMLWRYIEKLKEIGELDNTIIVFSADNGTSGYGKHSAVKQKGMHVPLIFFAPGKQIKKQGKQELLVSLADILPTFADIMGVKLPADYKLDGKSMWPFLATNKTKHNDVIYSWIRGKQMIRGEKVLRDGDGSWWNVETLPADHNSFPKINDWEKVSPAHRAERDVLKEKLKEYDKYKTEYNAPEYVKEKK